MSGVDMTGMRFGALLVLKPGDRGTGRWVCQCDCGKTSSPFAHNLRRGRANTCGCRMLSKTTFGDHRVCTGCKVKKPLVDFHRRRAGTAGRAIYCKACSLDRHKAHYAKNPAPYRAQQRAVAAKVKRETMEAYGGRCRCCGESRIEFLAIDHVNGGGAKHRQTLAKGGGRTAGTAFYRWLKRMEYPSEFQPLCCNCNWAKFTTGDCCPHKQPDWMPPQTGGGPFFCAVA